MAKTFLWKITHGFHVNAFTEAAPSNEDWNEMLDEFSINQAQIRGVLVHSEGGAPTAIQRKRLREQMKQMPRSALLTDSLMARAAMTAINLFSKSFNAFSPDKIDAALVYLEAPPTVWPPIKQVLNELKREMGIKPR